MTAPAPAAPKGRLGNASFAARSPSGSPPVPARTPPARSPETSPAFADLITVAGMATPPSGTCWASKGAQVVIPADPTVTSVAIAKAVTASARMTTSPGGGPVGPASRPAKPAHPVHECPCRGTAMRARDTTAGRPEDIDMWPGPHGPLVSFTRPADDANGLRFHLEMGQLVWLDDAFVRNCVQITSGEFSFDLFAEQEERERCTGTVLPWTGEAWPR